MIKRILDKGTLTADSTFLFGARQTGKTTLLLELFPNARLLVVSLDSSPRLFNGVEVWPVKAFLGQL